MAGFKVEVTVAGTAAERTITLPFTNHGTYNAIISWGDGTADSTVTTWNSANGIHTYALDGTYVIEITGSAPGWSINLGADRLKYTDIISWGDAVAPVFNGFLYLRQGFSGCQNLKSFGTGKILRSGTGPTNLRELFYLCLLPTSIPTGLFDNLINLAAEGFNRVFERAESLTSIPTDLFRYNTAVSTHGFSYTFYRCNKLESIPAGLFDYNVNLTTEAFSGCFFQCYPLTTIPTDLFRYNTGVSTYGFRETFQYCTGLTSIPTDLFKYNTLVSVSGFSSTFQWCALTTIPTDLFRYNISVSSNAFYNTFNGCTSLTTIPTDLFRYNTSVSTLGFLGTFSGCSNLTSAPELLFKYNVNALSFDKCFKNCHKMQQNAKIFYDTGEHTTRFLNKSIDFTECFYRDNFTETGAMGSAPDLWTCDFGTGTPTRTNCWSGLGNGLNSLTNYADIPSTWGGLYGTGTGFVTGWTVAGDASARTITLPLYNSGTFNCTVSWGDGTADSTITAFNSANRIHTYSLDGTYNVEINGYCPGWSFNNTGDILKITDIIGWGDNFNFGGFQYLTNGFYGCENILSIGTGKILAQSVLTSFDSIFRNCNKMKGPIPTGFFDNCVNVTKFYLTFYLCKELNGAIPADLFKYNTKVAADGFHGTFHTCEKLSGPLPTDLFRYNIDVSTNGFRTTFLNCYLLSGSIPVDFFRYNTKVTSFAFYFVFGNCSSLTGSIPNNLFDYNTLASSDSLREIFSGCSGLTGSIPTDLFKFNINVTLFGFNRAFMGCSGLTGSIPTDLFRYNTLISTNGFNNTFFNCSGLTGAIPTDLFRYNTLVSTSAFLNTFDGCSNLTSAPELLFKYNVNALSFNKCFKNCSKMQQNAKIFYDTGEHTTRFFNQTIDFTECFYRTSFSGIQGTAPNLWSCDFGTGSANPTDCWTGAGNSLTSLTNYNDIPLLWGGTYVPALIGCVSGAFGSWEFMIKKSATIGSMEIGFSQLSNSLSSGVSIVISNTESISLVSESTTLFTEPLAITLGVWHKIKLTRDMSGLFNLFVDNVSVGSATDNTILWADYIIAQLLQNDSFALCDSSGTQALMHKVVPI